MLSNQLQRIKNQKEEQKEEILRQYQESEAKRQEKLSRLKAQLENPYLLHHSMTSERKIKKKRRNVNATFATA
jgi:hypothetical protein